MKNGLKVSVVRDEATLPFDVGLVLVKVDTLSIFERRFFLISLISTCGVIYLINRIIYKL